MNDNAINVEAVELEAVIRELVYRLNKTREGSAAHRMIELQLIGIRQGSELGGLIIEEFAMRAELALPVR
jgi:hypothetical protein